jgi:hypothetical protein
MVPEGNVLNQLRAASLLFFQAEKNRWKTKHALMDHRALAVFTRGAGIPPLIANYLLMDGSTPGAALKA